MDRGLITLPHPFTRRLDVIACSGARMGVTPRPGAADGRAIDRALPPAGHRLSANRTCRAIGVELARSSRAVTTRGAASIGVIDRVAPPAFERGSAHSALLGRRRWVRAHVQLKLMDGRFRLAVLEHVRLYWDVVRAASKSDFSLRFPPLACHAPLIFASDPTAIPYRRLTRRRLPRCPSPHLRAHNPKSLHAVAPEFWCNCVRGGWSLRRRSGCRCSGPLSRWRCRFGWEGIGGRRGGRGTDRGRGRAGGGVAMRPSPLLPSRGGEAGSDAKGIGDPRSKVRYLRKGGGVRMPSCGEFPPAGRRTWRPRL